MWLLALLFAAAAYAEDIPAGRIIDAVKCLSDPSQTYALYAPANYSTDRAWPVIFAFDPGGRGRTPVERYQAGAEAYGYIVAGSNNSRNGAWDVSMKAANAMLTDVGARFGIDQKRIYTAGMSGGARVALGIALGSTVVAGAVASSAGYPDGKSRKTLPFALFGTAGNEDFNYLEMRTLDHELTSPHHVAIFEGGHVWLSSELATEAVEWMEIAAMKSGRKPRDQAQIDAIYTKRLGAVSAMKEGKDAFLALDALVKDFTGLRDVSEPAARAAALGRDKQVRDALKKERDEENRERRQTDELLAAENQLASSDGRPMALAHLHDRWKKLAAAANGPADSADRRIARRMLRGLSAGVAERVKDEEYRKMVEEFRPPRPPR
jgi:poly(3-hydroxybutyrate) depolymerase